MERETGFEPATSTLARSHSTTELFPPSVEVLMVPQGSTRRQPPRLFRRLRDDLAGGAVDHHAEQRPRPADRVIVDVPDGAGARVLPEVGIHRHRLAVEGAAAGLL